MPLSFRSRHAAAHQIRQLLGRLQWRSLADLHNLAGDPAAEAFLAVLENEVGEIAFIQPFEQRRRRLALRRIEPHVERPRLAKTQTALRIIELVGADAKVRQHGIDFLDA